MPWMNSHSQPCGTGRGRARGPGAGRVTRRCRQPRAALSRVQVVEVASLTEHLLTECDRKDGFAQCHRCSEAVAKDALPSHVKTKGCSPAKPEKLANRCPLCHENFAPGEEVSGPGRGGARGTCPRRWPSPRHPVTMRPRAHLLKLPPVSVRRLDC